MKNIYKKLVFLGLALICFLSIHGSASAQLLNLSSDNSNLQVGQSAVITATSGSGSGSVFFKQTPATGGRFDPTICTTTGGIMSTSCSVRFYPTSAGTYTISGTLTINGTTTQSLSSTNPRIKVTANTSTAPTLIGDIVDSTPPTIFQGDQVELKITASPIPSGGPTVFISSPTLGNIGTCVINTTAGGICTSGFGPIRLNTGIEGAHDINFSTTSWPNYTGTVSGTIKMTVQKTITNPPVLDVCFPPKIKTSTGACVDPSTIDTGYTYLAPLSEDKSFDPAQENALSKYINIIVKIAIGIAAVLAVIMIVMGGIQYMTSELISSKEEGKKRITNAILGLLIALGAYLILFTINPNLLKLDVAVPSTELSFTPGEDGLGTTPESTSTTSSGNVRRKVNLKLKTGGTTEVIACEATDKVQVSAFGTSFSIHKNLVPSLRRIDARWKQLNPSYKIPLTVADKGAMGGYVCRNARGMGKLSWHAYGLAVDINPSTNPAGNKLITDMPAAFVKLWKDEGWGWGGGWSSQKDAMHFSKGKNEGGDMTGE
ncbi:MAG: M15 family metallopeptidase [Candidatus Pacebacteria bacterium]|nr:M15 family metallopeptidase [Candidatus Paceibacterota bacterium]MBP9839371.1 M15 family metallopeptidase [Candidatus Paceibacterota bacterium]